MWGRPGRIAVATVFLGNLLALAIVGALRRPAVESSRLEAPARIAILEPHADDAAIAAGGLAIQNARLGGATLIVTITEPRGRVRPALREAENRRAWSLVTPPPTLRALRFPSQQPWPREQIGRARDSIASVLAAFEPELVVIPLDEGGHPEHDLVNRLGRDAARARPGARVLQASIYNPYYDPVFAPRKLFNLLVRMAPWVPYRDPTMGLPREGLSELAMTEAELASKLSLIGQYESQEDLIPPSQFGYPDLYQTGAGRPAGMIEISGKHLTVWALATILSVFALFVYAGILLGGSASSSRALGAIAAVGVLILAGLALSGRGRAVVLEELLYVGCVLVGVALGAGAREACGRLARR